MDEVSASALVTWEPTQVVPPRRLGHILSRARSDRGWTLEDAAEASKGRYGLWQLAAVERGTGQLGDSDLREICGIYGIDRGSLVPLRSHLVVDLEEGRLWVEETAREARVPPDSPRREVLARYLTMVYAMRGIDPGTYITMRADDLDTLGAALRTGTRSIRNDLAGLMDEPDGQMAWRTRLLSKRFLVPAAGMLVAVCGVGALILTSGDADQAGADAVRPAVTSPFSIVATTQPAAASQPAAVGPATVQERDASGAPGEVVERTG